MQDADSLDKAGKKSEGAFYLWSADEVDEVLGTDSERGRAFKRHYYVKPAGNTDLSPRRCSIFVSLHRRAMSYHADFMMYPGLIHPYTCAWRM